VGLATEDVGKKGGEAIVEAVVGSAGNEIAVVVHLHRCYCQHLCQINGLLQFAKYARSDELRIVGF